MAKQNIYDNDSFFENFKNLRNNKINFNDCIETPILLAMIPEVDGKRVLDIGCGMGQHAKQYSDMGAESVLGIDISEKMLATVYKGNIIKNLIMDCQSYTKYRPNETTGGIFVSWRRKEELPTGLD